MVPYLLPSRQVTFTDASPAESPGFESRIPDPALLDCHHRPARIIEAVGIDNAIDEELEDSGKS